MQKFRLLLLLIALVSHCIIYAQTDSLSKEDKAALDSMMAKDEFLQLMKGQSANAVDISIGMGNGAFSSHNNAANATGLDNQLIFTPAVMYRTKTGFSFGVAAFITNDSLHKPELYQTGLSAGYDYTGDAVNAGIAYTRYLSDKNKYNTKAIYQNDLYGYIKKAKGIIQPGLSFGFDNGKYKEVDVVLWNRIAPLADTLIRDSTNNKTTYFSATASIGHDFSFYKLFSPNDELDLTPMLMVNFGKDDLEQTTTNRVRPVIKRILSRRKKNIPSSKFEMQSVAASFDCTYSIGKFFLQPNVYLDYYLPQTTAKRLSAIFSVAAGFSF